MVQDPLAVLLADTRTLLTFHGVLTNSVTIRFVATGNGTGQRQAIDWLSQTTKEKPLDHSGGFFFICQATSHTWLFAYFSGWLSNRGTQLRSGRPRVSIPSFSKVLTTSATKLATKFDQEPSHFGQRSGAVGEAVRFNAKFLKHG